MDIYKTTRGIFHSKLTWEFLSRIFTIEYFRFFLVGFTVTPIFVNSINLISKNACAGEGKEKNDFCSIISGLSLPFSWEIMWIASIFYLVSYISYLLFCPFFVRKYKNIENYIYKNLPNRNIIHEWSDFVAKNRVNLINDEQFFKKLRNSLFNSKISVSIKSREDIKGQYIYEFIEQNNAGFILGSNGMFTMYGSSGERVMLINYSNNPTSPEYNNINEDYKEIVFSLFDLSEKIRVNCRFFCYFMIFLSGLCFSVVLAQNIMKTISYIVSGWQ